MRAPKQYSGENWRIVIGPGGNVTWLYPSMSRHKGFILNSIQAEGANKTTSGSHRKTAVHDFGANFTN